MVDESMLPPLIGDPRDPHFNPHTQPVTLFYPDTSNVTLSMAEFTEANYGAVKICIVFAVQVGACFLLGLVMVMISSPRKRNSGIFMLNITALAAVVARSILQILFFTGSWYDAYSYMAYDFTDVRGSDKHISVAAAATALLLEICCLVSLLLQSRVVYHNQPKLKLFLTISMSIITCGTVGLFLGATIQNTMSTLEGTSWGGNWIYPWAKGTFAGSISLFSGLFVFRLLTSAIERQRTLKMATANPIKVILGMGLQCMILPAIFSVTENLVKFDGMSSFTPTFVAMTLPLSAMWASTFHKNQKLALESGESWGQQWFRSSRDTDESDIDVTKSMDSEKTLVVKGEKGLQDLEDSKNSKGRTSPLAVKIEQGFGVSSYSLCSCGMCSCGSPLTSPKSYQNGVISPTSSSNSPGTAEWSTSPSVRAQIKPPKSKPSQQSLSRGSRY